MKTARLLTALALASLCPAAFASIGSPDDVTRALNAAGYADVRDVEYDDGLWEAEVRRPNGRWGEVALDARTGEVFDAMSARPLIDLPQVLAAIERAGYTRVHDLDREGALWDAEAHDAQGMRVELRISGYDGRVLNVRHDNDD